MIYVNDLPDFEAYRILELELMLRMLGYARKENCQYIWETKIGKKLPVSEMSALHIRNTLNKMDEENQTCM